jgi:hypothetical protein
MMDIDDKKLVIIGACLLMGGAMYFMEPQQSAELIKLGMAGLFGLAVGKGGDKGA